MTNTGIGTEMGDVAAKVATWLEKKLGILGWLMSWLFLAAAAGGNDSAFFTALGFAALTGASVLRRTPARWLEELGSPLGLLSAAGFGALLFFALISAKTGAQWSITRCLLVAFASSLVLGVGALMRHPEQIDNAWLSFRRFLDGVSGNPKPRGVFSCAWEAFAYFAIFAAASVSVLRPHFVPGAWAFLMQHGPKIAHPLSPRPLPPPEWPLVLTTPAFWLPVAGIGAVMFVVALRRAGLGSVMRGFRVWLSAMAEVLALAVGGAALVLQFRPTDLGLRVELVATALVCTAVVWFCHTRRRTMRGEPLGWNFPWQESR